jgi:hypothetical protein
MAGMSVMYYNAQLGFLDEVSLTVLPWLPSYHEPPTFPFCLYKIFSKGCMKHIHVYFIKKGTFLRETM